MIDRMPVFSDLLRVLKTGYDDILSSTVNQFNSQIGQAQDQLHTLNRENKDLQHKHKAATIRLNERDQEIAEQKQQIKHQQREIDALL